MANDQEQKDRLQQLHTWLISHKHIQLPFNEGDSSFLLQLLRACCYDVDASKKLAQEYARCRSVYPGSYVHDSASLKQDQYVQDMLEKCVIGPLPKLTRKGERVFIIPIGSVPGELSDKMDRMGTHNLELILDNPVSQINGLVFIVDGSGFSLMHLRHSTPSWARRSMAVLMAAVPGRVNCCHFVNVPFIFRAIVNMLRSFVGARLKNRLFVHATVESLHTHVSTEVLPEEYGGTEGSTKEVLGQWRDYAVTRRSYFDKFRKVSYTDGQNNN